VKNGPGRSPNIAANPPPG